MIELDEEVKNALVKRLADLTERHAEVERLLSDPDVIADSARLAHLAQEHGHLAGLADIYGRIREARQCRREARELLEEPDDELCELAREEIAEADRDEARLLSEAIEFLIADDAEANRNVIMEIRPGTGGEEAALFAADLFRMYCRYAEKKGWKTEIINAHQTDLGGFREVIFSISGRAVWKKLRYESGGHRVQRVPETESQGRIHTSLATVAVLPEPREVEVDIKPEDLDMSFVRSSGPGGQHVNKTSSCVRIVHKPTGITVRCQDQKSQQANRKKAMQVLRARLYEHLERQRRDRRDALRKSQVGSGDRNERIRTYNFPQDRMTDHRIGLDMFGLDGILMGNCDELFEALADYDRQKRVMAFAEGDGSPDGSTE